MYNPYIPRDVRQKERTSPYWRNLQVTNKKTKIGSAVLILIVVLCFLFSPQIQEVSPYPIATA